MKSTLGLVILAAMLQTACVGQPEYKPYAGQVAAPQVAYRIDDNRYFEVVPLESMACARARLYYTDKAKGIHTNVASWDEVSDGTFIIDASNDQYLITPIILSHSGCQAGGGDLCSNSLYFSKDAGKTWRDDMVGGRGSVTYLTGETVYQHHPRYKDAGLKASINVQIPEGPRWKVLPGGAIKRYQALTWTEFTNQKIPSPIKKPIDTQFHCNRDSKA
jgi:hypothetical protein